MIVDLELVKKQVRADEFADDDALLQSYTEAAEEYVINGTRRTLDELKAMSADGMSFPKPLEQAVLMLVGHWYNQREAVTGIQMREVPYTFQALVLPYRKLVK